VCDAGIPRVADPLAHEDAIDVEEVRGAANGLLDLRVDGLGALIDEAR
jgi:hypothetical protein